MPLTEAFNRDFDAQKINNSLLRVFNGFSYYYYDFGQRMILGSNGEMISRFAQADRDVLIAARDRLVELKGNPPELPPETPATQAPARKLNL